MKRFLLRGVWSVLFLCVVAPLMAQSAEDIAGEYIENTFTDFGYYSTTDPVTIDFPEEDSITITNIQGYNTTIGGRVDWESRTVTFQPQRFITTTIANILPDGTEVEEEIELTFSSDSVPTPVVGTIAPSGVLTLGAWRCVTFFDDETGGYWDYPTNLNMQWTQFLLPNAKMKTRDIDGVVHNYRVHISYSDESNAAIINFGGKATVFVTIRHDGTLQMKGEQPFYYYNNYMGYASMFYASYSESGAYEGINLYRNIHGVGSATRWEFDPWTVCFNSASQYPRREWLTQATIITLNEGTFSYPEMKDYGWQGEGSASKPFLLSSAGDFELLADYVYSGEFFDGFYFKLSNDIDFTGSTFRGVGTGMSSGEVMISAYHFDGVLDGAGYKLSNLHIEGINYNPQTGLPNSSSEATIPSLNYVGLFGELRGSIKNLTIDETCSFAGDSYVGAFAGETKTTIAAEISNCYNFAKVTALSEHAGGILGSAGKDTKLTNCYNGGEITGGLTRVGGLVGYLFRSEMIGCQNDGTITSVDTLLYSTGQRHVGGLTGYCCGSTITDCVNTGTVSAPESVGGLVGEIYNKSYLTTISSSYNVGALMALDEKKLGNIAGSISNATPMMNDMLLDSQMRPYGAIAGMDYEGVVPMTTAQITSGNCEPFYSELWNQTPGAYPTLKAFAHINHDWATNYITFAENESAYDFTTAKIHHSQAVLSLGENSPFTLAWENGVGTLSAPTLPANTIRDTLTLTCGKAQTQVLLRKLPAISLSGEGTEQSPYLITSVDEYLAFAEYVNAYNDSYEGKFIKVTKPLNFSGRQYVIPYAGGSTRFEGTFDGNMQSFSNIEIMLDNVAAEASRNKGLFGSVGEKGVLKNIGLSNSIIIGYSDMGGIVGVLCGTLENCVTAASTTVQVYTRNVAGLAGSMHGNAVIRNCTNRATVFGSEYCAGVTILAEPTTVQILSTKNYGTIFNHVAEERIYGGSSLAGFAVRFGGLMQDCENHGTIDSWDDYAAGFAVWCGEGSRFVNCVNYGSVLTRSSNVVSGYAAGICSNTTAAGNVLFDRCGNAGQVRSRFNYAAGICGLANAEFRDCWNTGEVSAANVYAAGIAALTPYDKSKFLRCWNTGDIIVSDGDSTRHTGFYAAGIVGQTSDFMIPLDECWNAGLIVNNRLLDNQHEEYEYMFTATGGLVGEGCAQINDCFNVGNIRAGKDAGGLMGYPGIDFSAHRCWSAANVYSTNDLVAPGNLVGGQSLNGWDLSHLYFDIDAAGYSYPFDAKYNALSREGLTSGDLSEAMGSKFDCSAAATYPQLRSFMLDETETDAVRVKARKTATVACATYVLDGNDLYGNDRIEGAVAFVPGVQELEATVTKPIRLGLVDHVKWTATGGLTIVGDYAYPTATGEASLTVSMEGCDYSKTFLFTVEGTVGIDHVDQDAAANAVGYDLYGRRVNERQMQNGGFYMLQNGKKILKQ